MMKSIAILLSIILCTSAYAADYLTGFSEDTDLPVLNEMLRKIDRALLYGRLRTSDSDDSMGYLDSEILDITVIGSVTDGEIAGWTIGETFLKSGTTTTTVGLDSGGTNPAIYCGHATPASAPFRVTNAGAVTATSGSIGGWTLAGTGLSGGSGEDYIGLIPGTGIYMGNETFGSAEFSVTKAGVLKATSGTIGGWDITASTLESPSDAIVLNDTDSEITVGVTGSTHLQIDGANVHIRSSDYASGALGSGWNIDANTAEFNNIRARGKFSTSVFEKTSISVIGGNLLVMPGDILASDMTGAD